MSRDAEIQRLIDIVNASEVNRVSKPFAVEDLYKEDKKEELQEAIRVQVDTPEEAQLFMSIMQNAGIENREAHAEAEEEIEQGADYRNSPDEKYDDDDPMDTYSTKPTKQKMFRRTWAFRCINWLSTSTTTTSCLITFDCSFLFLRLFSFFVLFV